MALRSSENECQRVKMLRRVAMMNTPPGRSKKPALWLYLSVLGVLGVSGSTRFTILILLVGDVATLFVWGSTIRSIYEWRR